MNYYHKTIPSPVGNLKLIVSDKGLAAVIWENDDADRILIKESKQKDNHPLLLNVEKQLNEYFNKKRTRFEIKLDFAYGTSFQQQVWQALLTIPFGVTRTYGQIAQQINNPKSVRAVGAAANKNPISIVTPCHRVIGTSGKLVGFAGGISTKSFLIKLEDSRKNPTLW